LQGNDCLPDLLYGRFPAQNPEELQYQIEKSISYEKGETDPFESHLAMIYHYNDSIHKLSQNLAVLQNNFWQGKNSFESSPLLGDPGVKDYWKTFGTRNEGTRASVTLQSNEFCQFSNIDGTYNIGPSGTYSVDFYGFWGGNIYKSQGRPSRVSIALNNFAPVNITFGSNSLPDGSKWSVYQTCSMIWRVQATGCSSKSQYTLRGEGYSVGATKKVSISYIVNGNPDNILVLKPESKPESFSIYGGTLSMMHNYELFLAIIEQYKLVYADSTVEWRDSFNMSKVIMTEPFPLASQMAHFAYYHGSPLFWASPCYKIRIVPSNQ